MEPPKTNLTSELEKKLYSFLVDLNNAVRDKQDRIEDESSPKMKEARELMRSDPYYSLFNIPSESYHNRKKDWNSFLGKNFERLLGIILEPYIPNPYPEKFKLKRGRQLCDYPVIFNNKKFALEVKNRFGTFDRKVQDSYIEMFDQIKNIDNGEWQPTMLLRMTDNQPTAIRKWSNKGWKIYQGNEMNDFIKKYAGFDINNFLNKIILPRIRAQQNLEDFLSEQTPEGQN